MKMFGSDGSMLATSFFAQHPQLPQLILDTNALAAYAELRFSSC